VFYTRSCKKTQSSSPEDGRNYRPKHVELIEVINKWPFLVVYIIVSMMHGHANIKQQNAGHVAQTSYLFETASKMS